MKTNEVVTGTIELFRDNNVTFDEAMQGLSEMGIKNQKVVKVILTAIGRHYTSIKGA